MRTIIFIMSICTVVVAHSMDMNKEPSRWSETTDFEENSCLNAIELTDFDDVDENDLQESLSHYINAEILNEENSAQIESIAPSDLTIQANESYQREELYNIAAEMIKNSESCSCAFKSTNCEVLQAHLRYCETFRTERESFLQMMLESENESKPVYGIDGNEISDISTSFDENNVDVGTYRLNESRAGLDENTLNRDISKTNRSLDRPILHKQCACGKSFSGHDLLVAHIAKKHSYQQDNQFFYSCPIEGCSQKSCGIYGLLDHYVMSHTYEKVQLICFCCSRSFKTFDMLLKHEQTHKNEEESTQALSEHTVPGNNFESLPCVDRERRKLVVVHKQCACGDSFNSGVELEEHVKKTHTVRIKNKIRYVCPAVGCGNKPKESLGQLLDHFSIKHTKEKIFYHCRFCDRVITSLDRLRKHEREHQKQSSEISRSVSLTDSDNTRNSEPAEQPAQVNQIAPVDVDQFEKKEESDIDLDSDTEFKLGEDIDFFSADVQAIDSDEEMGCLSDIDNAAAKPFEKSGDCVMQGGKIVNSVKRPYKCDVVGCSKAYKKHRDLKKHVDRVHKNLKPFVCSYLGCKYATDSNSHLKRHKGTHIGKNQNQNRAGGFEKDLASSVVIKMKESTDKVGFKRKRSMPIKFSDYDLNGRA